MAQRKRKQDRTTGKGKRNNPADSTGTDGAIEGQSPAENSTNTPLLEICPRGNNKLVIIIFPCS